MQKNLITTHKSKVCFGITNITPDGYFLPFWDYDHRILRTVESELIPIQVFLKLSDIYIIKSKNGYNALCLDKVNYTELKKIYDSSIKCCQDFIKFGLKRGCFTLRLGKDKKLVHILKSNFSSHKKSLSHAIALNEFFDNSFIIDTTFDNNYNLRFKAYRSEKDGFIKVIKW